jgi:hypothetical protein
MFLETMFTLFLCHEPGQTANLGVFGAGNIVAAHARRFPNGRLWRDRQWPRSIANFGCPSRHRALFDSPIIRRVIA